MYTVLICDDDKDIVSALEIYLTSEGYKTVSAYNGEQAIQAVNEGNIDLILMDIMMPQLDGIRATARLRESGGNIPIILLTAKSEDSDKPATQDADGVLRNGSIVMDDEAKSVTVDGESVSLTPIEYNILRLLMKNLGRVYSTAQIYEQVWNDPALGSENTVAVHIRHLREKIEIDPANPRYLKVVWGLGYKMEKMQ